MTVAQLPADSTEPVFATLQQYSDGREDAWIEPVTQDIPNPDMPAPSLTVAPAPPEATAALSTSAAPSSEAASSTTAQPQTTSEAAEDDSTTGTIAVVAGVLIVAAIGTGAWWWRSRRAGQHVCGDRHGPRRRPVQVQHRAERGRPAGTVRSEEPGHRTGPVRRVPAGSVVR